IRDAVPAGAALQIREIARGRHQIAEMNDVHGGGHPVGKMVQVWSPAIGERKVVHIALAMQPGGSNASVRSVLLRVFGEPKSERHVKIHRALHVGRKDIEMIEPLRMHPFMIRVLLQQPLARFHLEAELDRHAERINGGERAALIGTLDKSMLDGFGFEEMRRPVEVILRGELEAKCVGNGALSFLSKIEWCCRSSTPRGYTTSPVQSYQSH